MDDSIRHILEIANELGHMIKETDIYRNFELASEKLELQPNLLKLLEEYEVCMQIIHERQSSGDVVEKFELDNLRELTKDVSENDLLMEFIKAKDEYVKLLTMIQEAVTESEDHLMN